MSKITQDRETPNQAGHSGLTDLLPAVRPFGPEPVLLVAVPPLRDRCHCVVCGPVTPASALLRYVDARRRRRVRRVGVCRGHLALEVAALQSAAVYGVRVSVPRVAQFTVNDVYGAGGAAA